MEFIPLHNIPHILTKSFPILYKNFCYFYKNVLVIRVQFSSERDEINAFTKSLARLHGAITAREKSNALMELYKVYEHWKDLGK